MSALKQAPVPFAQQPKPVKPSITLFSDEAKMKRQMMSDGIDEMSAENQIKARRTELFGGDSKILPKEAEILKRMADD